MKKTYNILLHVAFWVLFAILPLSTLFTSDETLPGSTLFYIIFVYFLHAINFYIVYLYLFPLLFKKNKIWLNIMGSLAFIILFAVVRWVMIKYGFKNLLIEMDQPLAKFLQDNAAMIFEYIVHSFVFTAYAFLLRLTYGWFIDQKQKAELITQNQASELAMLRYQINPHFLFNTLNNIYSLVYKKDDKAPDAVMRLSEILHYTLYKSNSESVPLESEIVYLKSFIELQTLRFSSTEFVKFTIEGEADKKCIEPMLLLPFVENAFKHCTKEGYLPGIIIHIRITNDVIDFYCRNYVNTQATQNKDESGGIGLKNIKRRIQLLYPGAHELEINREENEFYVRLILKNK